jgi:sn-1 stearoyl-lipid 9-desaturase
LKDLTRRGTGRRTLATGMGLGFIHLAACAAFFPVFFSWSGVLLAFIFYYLTAAIGITLGYHRMLTHRSFRVPRPLEYVITTIGTLALQGGPIDWVSTHRTHHAFSDTERDPHNASRGFWWSHVAWLYRPNPARLSHEDELRYASDIAAVPYYRFLETTSIAWQVALGLVLLAFGGWSWVVWGVFVRLVVTYHVTWFVNSAAHLSGYRSFRTAGQDHSTNNWWVAILAWGEGWHNNHHAFPFSARHGLRWWEFDMTWLTIRTLELLGIARGVKIPNADMIARRSRFSSSRWVKTSDGVDASAPVRV